MKNINDFENLLNKKLKVKRVDSHIGFKKNLKIGIKNMKQINFYTEEIIQIKNLLEKLLDENIKIDMNEYEYLKELLYKKLQEIDMNIYSKYDDGR